MKKEVLNPAGLFPHPGYSRVVTLMGPMKLILLAGQTASDENYRCVAPGDMRAQYIRVMENLNLQLVAASATWNDVVYRRTFVRDVDAYLKVVSDPTTKRYFDPDAMPGSTMIGVTRLSDPEFLIEVVSAGAIIPH